MANDTSVQEATDAAPPPIVRIVEAMLFAGGEPITAKIACAAIRGLTPDQFRSAIDELTREYRRQNRPYGIQPRDQGYVLKLIDCLNSRDAASAGKLLYNSLEAPALEKYPLLVLFQEFFRANGAAGTLMSGSGSTTFAIVRDVKEGHNLADKFKVKFGSNNWIAVVEV